MLEALLISNVLLWLVVVGLGVAVVALLRQVGLLHERVAPAGALMTGPGPRIGHPAPQLEVTDWTGASLTIGGTDSDGLSTLLFFVSPTCPLCKTMLPIVDSVIRREQRRARLVLASDGDRSEHEAFVAEQPLLGRHPYVLSTELGVAYHVGQLPHAVLIDSQGVLRGRGLVNTREHLESLFEAEDRGVASLQEYLGRQRAAGDVA